MSKFIKLNDKMINLEYIKNIYIDVRFTNEYYSCNRSKFTYYVIEFINGDKLNINKDEYDKLLEILKGDNNYVYELEQERDKYKNIVKEIGEMIFNDDTYIHYDENIEDHYIYESDLIDAYKYLLEELENGDSNE